MTAQQSLAFVVNALIGGRVTVYTQSDAKLSGVLESSDERIGCVADAPCRRLCLSCTLPLIDTL